ncbi:MAG: RNA-guided pseudouridylation complex pseudouridine synthase subunit Cbf5, partial [Candidatus Nanohaloarchaea archaeon]
MRPSMAVQEADWCVREEAETDWEHGQRPEERSVEDTLANGLVIVDKPD